MGTKAKQNNYIREANDRFCSMRKEYKIKKVKILAVSVIIFTFVAMQAAYANPNGNNARGQGNAAVVGMHDPFGFEKDPNCLGAERGRPFGAIGEEPIPDEIPNPEDDPIHDEVLCLINLEEDLTFSWETENQVVENYQQWIDIFNGYIEKGCINAHCHVSLPTIIGIDASLFTI